MNKLSINWNESRVLCDIETRANTQHNCLYIFKKIAVSGKENYDSSQEVKPYG